MKQILVIEDDHALGNGIVLALQSDAYALTHVKSLSAARACMKARAFDLVILDINLPDGSGLAFLQEWKGQSQAAIIILTANDLETDIVTGLEQGADDYITKPFSLMVLRARVNARLRAGRAADEMVIIDSMTFAFDKMRFTKNGVAIELSKTEQRLLRSLVTNRGQTLPRATLVDAVWTDGAEYVDENALSVTIKRLRGKLEDDPAAPRYIKTVYGIGYMWAVN